MSDIPRRDKLVDEAIDILNQHFRRSKMDYAVAFNTLGHIESEFITNEIRKCVLSPRYYLENYHTIQTEDEGFRTLYPFWDSQEIFYNEIVDMITAGKPVKCVVLKARQLGLSTLSEGLIFHKTIFTRAVNSLIVAQDPGQSAYLFDMFLRAYDNLPWWMRPEKLFRSKGKYLVFNTDDPARDGLNSQIMVEAANKLSGVAVGKTVRAVHLSELSAWDAPEILTEQLWPTMNAKDELAIMESTARGRSGTGKFWYDFWNECVDKWGSDDTWEWKPIFIEWFRCSVSTIDNGAIGKYSRSTAGKVFEPTPEEITFRQKVLQTTPDHFFIPDEMLKWRRYKIQETISATGDEYSFKQEYPCNPIEAFKSSGTCAFPREMLSKILDTTCFDPRWVGEISYRPNENQRFHLNLTDVAEERKKNPRYAVPSSNYIGGRLRVWERPEPGESYYIGADVAQGIEGRDYSCAQVIKIGHGGAPDEQVAEWHGWINPTPYAHVLAALGYWYNTCEISSEINDCGQKTYMELYRILEYPQLFRWKHYDRVKNFYSDLMAWQTTSKTRPLLITKLRELLLDRAIILHSEQLVDELYTFASDDDGGRFEGQDNNDDMAFGLMISLWCAHDSDFGQQAASKPQSASAAKYYVIDGRGLPVPQCHPSGEPVSREEAMGWCSMNPTWSVRRQMQRMDLANTDFSPVHDRQGPRQAMHYEMGIPAEHISGSNIIEQERTSPDQDWRNW